MLERICAKRAAQTSHDNCGSKAVAFDVARSFGIPVYDVNLTGYPKRMREWTSRQRRPKGR